MNPQEELYCILDDDSPFKGLVVDKKMVAFIGNGCVKHKRTTQPNGKQVCSFAFSEYNFHAGRKLSKEEVRHIGTTQPGHLTQGDPDRVYELGQLAKSQFMITSRTKASVPDALEDAFRRRTQTAASIRKNLLLHVAAIQNALGGNPSDLAQMGQFVKCPVQIEWTKQQPKPKVWRETPCACHLVQCPECPNSKATQQIFVKQKLAHDRKEKQRNTRKNGKRN